MIFKISYLKNYYRKLTRISKSQHLLISHMNMNPSGESGKSLFEYLKRIWGDVCTVGENIIDTTKMRNNFSYPLKIVIFQILR
jgi:hypothetical protein